MCISSAMTNTVLLTHHHHQALANAAERGFWMPLPLRRSDLDGLLYLTALSHGSGRISQLLEVCSFEPWRVADGRLWGPGVLDMKGGVAFFIHAMRALRALEIPVASKVVLQLNSDEEVGSHSSRALTEAMALKSKCVLVLEPGTGLTGKLKTARKGVGGYDVVVHGKAAHAGVDFTNGANAINELARQITVIEGFTDLSKGLTVNPGVIRGGTRTNVVPA